MLNKVVFQGEYFQTFCEGEFDWLCFFKLKLDGIWSCSWLNLNEYEMHKVG